MGFIIAHRIDYNWVEALRDQRHIPNKINPSTLFFIYIFIFFYLTSFNITLYTINLTITGRKKRRRNSKKTNKQTNTQTKSEIRKFNRLTTTGKTIRKITIARVC